MRKLVGIHVRRIQFDSVCSIGELGMGFLSSIYVHMRSFLMEGGDDLDHRTKEVDPVTERRALLTKAGLGIDDVLDHGALGIAFSGGGIRSATISLGVTQSLVQEARLLDFDYCSTVSGGGYFGSFLVSLFLPERARGPQATATQSSEAEETASLLEKKKIAFDALGSKASSVNLTNPGDVRIGSIRNPIWWLREHSRYLAPNGTSDYLLAAVYMVRNWMALMYVMALPIALAALALIVFDSWVLSEPEWLSSGLVEVGRFLNSPAWLVVMLFAFASLVTAAAFWSSEAMSNRHPAPYDASLLVRICRRAATPRAAMSVVSLITLAVACGLLQFFAPGNDWLDFYKDIASHSLLDKAAAVGCALLALSSALGFIILNTTWGGFRGDALVAEVRRRITLWNSRFVKAMLVAAALALVDSVAIWLYHMLARDADWIAKPGAALAALFPIIAWIVNKAQEWVKEKDSFIKRLVGRSISTIALVLGGLMLLLLSVGIHLFMQGLLFDGDAWILAKGGPKPSFVVVLTILSVLTLVTGWFTGFVNLSSLHGIYAARLTRAYLGASNIRRLTLPQRDSRIAKTSIKDSDPHDQIPVDVYQQTRHLGPLHLINVTLNETRSPEGSQLLERDRKGVPVVFAPEGIFVNAARERKANKKAQAKSWAEIEHADAERLSVGQLCAISGAAASTAMGSQTTLGGALAMSFANIRLGYWWNAKGLFRVVPKLREQPIKWLYQKGTRPLRTFYYLANELVANYTRGNARLNLSDGGHFDNSGAYELLRRRVKGIVVCDNGADPDFRFGDLEVLIRKARIDLGLAIEVADAATVEKVMGKDALPLFLNGDKADWRARAAARNDRSGPSSPEDKAHCLLLEAFDASKSDNVATRILWIKPRLFTGLPQDVLGYALAHPDFPHETTGDQFFDEAQWESYRALGYTMMAALLAGPMGHADTIRGLVDRPKAVGSQTRPGATKSPAGVMSAKRTKSARKQPAQQELTSERPGAPGDVAAAQGKVEVRTRPNRARHATK